MARAFPKKGPSLRGQLLLFMMLALTPAAILAVWQGVSAYRHGYQGLEQSIAEAANAESRMRHSFLLSVKDVMSAIAVESHVAGLSTPHCQAVLDKVARISDVYQYVVAYRTDGRLGCGAPAAAESVVDQDWFQKIQGGAKFAFGVDPADRTLLGRVVHVAVPLKNDQGSLSGILDAVVRLPQDVGASAGGGVTILVDRNGDPIDAESAKRVAGMLPPASILASHIGSQARNFAATSQDGKNTMFAISPVQDIGLYAVAARQPRASGFFTHRDLILLVIIPLVIWISAAIVIWVGVDALVVRWIVYLNRIASIYVKGRYSAKPRNAASAPMEFRALAETLARMADVISLREAQLLASLDQKNILVREVHHRVKNNLQIIVSLLNIKSREMASPAESTMFTEAKTRIGILALIHHSLYQGDDYEYVDIVPLLHSLSQHLQHTEFGRQPDPQFVLDVPPLAISGDIAVPLALLIAEIVSIGDRVKDRRAGTRKISLSLTVQAPRQAARLIIRASNLPDLAKLSDMEDQTGRLIREFAHQIGGSVTFKQEVDAEWNILMPHFFYKPPQDDDTNPSVPLSKSGNL